MKCKTFFLLIVLIFGSCKTSTISVTKSNTDTENTSIAAYDNGRYSIVFPTHIEIKNNGYKEIFLSNIHLETNDDIDYNYHRIYKENGQMFKRYDGGSYITPNSILKLNILMAIPIDSLQAKKIANFHEIEALPKWKDTIKLTNYKDFTRDLKTIKVANKKSLYDEVFCKIEFNLLFQDSIEDEMAETLYYN